ncbi:ATP-binding cassette sub-family B member 10, mitochondrial isoform X2 [Hydra vulgaris]|uniref:ATP-binding cassette sub-family B member 10, mitochondrial isoform X2 n=1 Tax=Hydra vulgaris TaxID=6087 RepID=A0ABM4CH68_HYDVU
MLSNLLSRKCKTQSNFFICSRCFFQTFSPITRNLKYQSKVVYSQPFKLRCLQRNLLFNKKWKSTGVEKTLSSDVKRLLSLAYPERWTIGGSVVLMLVFSSISMSVPFFMGKIIDVMYSSKAEDHMEMLSSLRSNCYLLSGVFFIGALANMGRLYMIQTAGQRIIQQLRKKTFKSIISQEIAFFDQTSAGELTNRLSNDTILVGKAVTDNISDGLRALTQAVGGISLMVYTCPKLAGVSLFVVPPVVLFAVIYGRYVRSITKRVQDKLADSSKVAEERLSNMRTVRAFAQEENEIVKYDSKISDVYKLSQKEALARSAFFGFNSFTGNVIVLAVLYNGAKMMVESNITVGDLTSFLIYTVYVGISIAGMGSFYTELMRGIGASSRIWQLNDKQPEIPLRGGMHISDVIKNHSVLFKDVCFNYPSRKDLQVLSNFHLYAESGSSVAIVGESGSGKSTVGSLLLRFYNINSGSITIGGVNINELDPYMLRESIGTVSQEPVLFSTTIANNISYGLKNDATFEEIVSAAKQANAYNFIMNFPDGFNTIVGEKGLMLSGGQRQRITIARAILKNPKILLLDEATSSLDAESEYLVQDALQKLMNGRTTLIVAHRLSTIKSANKIAVLKQGKISEIGTYQELLSKNDGLFRQLVERQSFAG